MDAVQILLLLVVAGAAVVLLRRFLLTRSVPRYSAAEVAGRIQDRSPVVLLDVRTPAERGHYSIPGSMHIPLQELRRRAGELDRHRNKEVICYCASGSRSLAAAGLLRSLGVNAANMKGGIAAWRLEAGE